MKKYSKKRQVKSVGFFARIFNLFYDLYVGEEIEKSFKSVVMSFQGKSNKQIEEHFKMQEYIKEIKMKEQAKKHFNM